VPFVMFTECVNILSQYNFWSWKESVLLRGCRSLCSHWLPYIFYFLVPFKPRFTFWVRPQLSHS